MLDIASCDKFDLSVLHLYSTIKSILIHEYQHGSTRINTSQHESTRVRHESTRVNTSPKQVNKSKKVKKSSRRVNASQQKSDMSLT